MARVEVADDELLVRRELVVLPDEDHLDGLVAVFNEGVQRTIVSEADDALEGEVNELTR